MRRTSMAFTGTVLVAVVILAGALSARADLIVPGQTRTPRPQARVSPGTSQVTGFKLRIVTTPPLAAPPTPGLLVLAAGAAVIVAVGSLSWLVLRRLAATRSAGGPPDGQ
jgi:hypothetical protein